METANYKDTPQKIFDIAEDCYNEYKSGELGDGVYMASGSMVSNEFVNRCKTEGFDTEKFNIPEIAGDIESDVDENNSHLMSKYAGEPPEPDEDDMPMDSEDDISDEDQERANHLARGDR